MKSIAKQIFFNSNVANKKIQLSKCRLDDLFPQLLVSSSNATIEITDTVMTGVSMLVRLSESLASNLVVINNGSPVGMLGAKQVLSKFIKNPTCNFLHNTIIKNIMNGDPCFVDKSTKFFDLMKKLQKLQTDFAILQESNGMFSSIIQDDREMFSTISIKRILELGLMCDTDVTISQIHKKPAVFCSNDDTVRTVIQTMLHYNVNDVVIQNSPFIITGRAILEKIQREIINPDDVLQCKVSDLNPYEATLTNKDLSIPDLCKLMLTARHPYVMTASQVFTPYDLIYVLS
ncbi:MAG: CBS domain-containing protein [Nitrosopumilaceae archaeon]|nr:CBS domain-containing protein [Nitrosopumilaceae archaeon]